jgi:hypothetical protein
LTILIVHRAYLKGALRRAIESCAHQFHEGVLSFVHAQSRFSHPIVSSVYEAAALALAEFRRCGFTDTNPGRATFLTVAVKAPATTHEVSVGKLQDWLSGGAKSPKELLLKNRLRELVG